MNLNNITDNGRQQPQDSQPQQYNQPIRLYDPVKKANASLVLGLVGILAWLLPTVGIIICCIGIVTGVTGMKSSQKGRATAGFVLSIIFLVFSVIFGAIFCVGALVN